MFVVIVISITTTVVIIVKASYQFVAPCQGSEAGGPHPWGSLPMWSDLKVQGAWLRVLSLVFKVLRFRVLSLGFRGSGFWG